MGKADNNKDDFRWVSGWVSPLPLTQMEVTGIDCDLGATVGKYEFAANYITMTKDG